jgi:hypothetical protein
MFMRVCALLAITIVLIGGPNPIGATTYTVRPDGSGDFPTIQAAVNAAVDGDVIELGSGTFTGAGNRDVDIDGKVITIRSQSGNPATCTIDCQGAGRGFYLPRSQGRAAFAGITIANGVAEEGAGIFDDSDRGLNYTDCVFYRNAAEFAGGGLSALESVPTLVRCAFIENSSGMVGGGFSCGRSGSIGSLTIEDCQFIGNTAVELGGAVSLETVSPMREAILRGCTFVGNSAEIGAAAMTSGVDPTFERCTFAGNASAQWAGTLDGFGLEDYVLRNCILAFSASGAAVRCHDSATATLICCDVFGNAGGDWVGCIAGQEGQNGNLALDPLLCDLEGGDLHLQDGSPCAPDYNPDCGLIGALPVGCQPTPVEEKTWGAIKALYR